jgi:hypothetical protein
VLEHLAYERGLADLTWAGDDVDEPPRLGEPRRQLRCL